MQLFAELEKKTEEFKTASGLRCAAGCGRCCENPKIHITVLEVFPLASQLWHNKTAESVLTKIAADPAAATCMFYQPDPVVEGNGRCGVYTFRPLLCRLFGYATVQDKNQHPQLVTCPTMKSLCAQEITPLAQALKEGRLMAPKMQNYAMQLYNIDPYLGKEQLPINQAIKIALEKLSVYYLK